jgi:hypothetical protein
MLIGLSRSVIKQLKSLLVLIVVEVSAGGNANQSLIKVVTLFSSGVVSEASFHVLLEILIVFTPIFSTF